MKDFASRLNKAMNEKKISPGMLAIKTGISERMIRQYQSRSAMPGSYSLKEIATALQVSTDWLLGIKEETNGNEQNDGRGVPEASGSKQEHTVGDSEKPVALQVGIGASE